MRYCAGAERKQREVESQQVPVGNRPRDEASAQSTQEINKGGERLLPFLVAHQVELKAKHECAELSDLLKKNKMWNNAANVSSRKFNIKKKKLSCISAPCWFLGGTISGEARWKVSRWPTEGNERFWPLDPGVSVRMSLCDANGGGRRVAYVKPFTHRKHSALEKSPLFEWPLPPPWLCSLPFLYWPLSGLTSR